MCEDRQEGIRKVVEGFKVVVAANQELEETIEESKGFCPPMKLGLLKSFSVGLHGRMGELLEIIALLDEEEEEAGELAAFMLEAVQATLGRLVEAEVVAREWVKGGKEEGHELDFSSVFGEKL